MNILYVNALIESYIFIFESTMHQQVENVKMFDKEKDNRERGIGERGEKERLK